MTHRSRAACFFAFVSVILGQTTAPARFEVASVKVLPDLPSGPDIRSGGRIRRSTTLMGLIMYAYRLQGFQIFGMPKPPTSWYVIDAETDPSATDDHIRLMFQTLLADRFKLVAHRETRDLDGYSLVVGKNGARIKPVPDEGKKPAPLPPWFASRGDAFAAMIEGQMLVTKEGKGTVAFTARRASMAQAADAIEQQLQMIVLDQTGLPGKYYFGFKCLQTNNLMDDADVPTLFNAVQEELGLRLDKQKHSAEILIVERFESVPTQN
jgi:uncharacterized protein (TIGR03435 family)